MPCHGPRVVSHSFGRSSSMRRRLSLLFSRSFSILFIICLDSPGYQTPSKARGLGCAAAVSISPCGREGGGLGHGQNQLVSCTDSIYFCPLLAFPQHPQHPQKKLFVPPCASGSHWDRSAWCQAPRADFQTSSPLRMNCSGIFAKFINPCPWGFPIFSTAWEAASAWQEFQQEHCKHLCPGALGAVGCTGFS